MRNAYRFWWGSLNERFHMKTKNGWEGNAIMALEETEIARHGLD
jgi:hypothetical protein